MTKLIESISHMIDPNSDGGLTHPDKVSIFKLDANDAYKYAQIDNEQEYFVTEFKPNNYEKPNLEAVVAKTKYLNDEQRSKLLAVLQKNEHIFMGIKGTYAGP